jgi:hypothetical protein
MAHRPDVFSGMLFEKGNPNPPEVLRPAPGAKNGEMVDDKGNVYDSKGNMASEKPSPHLERALKIVRDQIRDEKLRGISEEDETQVIGSDPRVQFYLRQLKARETPLIKRKRRNPN